MARAETRPDLAAELYLDLGIVQAAAGDYDAAIAAFDRSRTRMGNRSDQQQMVQEGPLPREFHYHLGRILFEGRKNLSLAVSELDEAVRLEPENPLGPLLLRRGSPEAHRGELADQGTRDHLKTYLDAGVPVSRYPDIEQFLQSPGTTR